MPSRLVEGSKFTLERLDDLEKQIAHVGRLNEKAAHPLRGGLKRERDADDPTRRLVVLPRRLMPGDEDTNGVRYIGPMLDGQHVYEKQKQKRLYQQSPLVWK